MTPQEVFEFVEQRKREVEESNILKLLYKVDNNLILGGNSR